MARDAGFSSLFVGGLAMAVFGTVRAFRREIESGTIEMALSHPVSRGVFFLSKIAGSALALIVFSIIVFATVLVIVEGAAIGGAMAEQTGDIARIWGPCVAAGLASVLLPPLIGAILNRFGRFRFVLTVFLSAFLWSLLLGGAALFLGKVFLLPYLKAALPILVFLLAFVSLSAALAVRFAAHAAVSLSGAFLLLILPFTGNFYLADALVRGGTVPTGFLVLSIASAFPALAAFLVLGIIWTTQRT